VKERWTAEQDRLKVNVVLDDDFDWALDADEDSDFLPLSLVGAVDISYSRNDN
jgi:hypothetical protein